ncbi:MAG: lytic transglycosylase domain-containing protein [Acidobacteriota bacterium]
MRRATRIGVLGAMGCALFLAGLSLRDAAEEPLALLTSGVSIEDRLASLRMRTNAVERENENLRTELQVRQALARAGHHLGPAETDRVVASVMEAHNRYGLPTDVLLAVIDTESGFDSQALSARGARGLMQVMPATGQEIARDLNIPWTGDEILYDPVINIQVGSEYLHRMFRRFGHADNALAAYNAGPARVEKLTHAGILPRNYPGRVRKGLQRYAP